MSAGERVCWFVVAAGTALTAAPFVAGDALAPLGNARFALGFVGFIAGLSAFVTFFFLRARDRVRRQLLAGDGLLARWKYSDAEWRAFAGEESGRQAGSKRALLVFTAIFMAVVTIVFIARDRRAGVFVGGVLLAVWILCWVVVRASVRAQTRRAAATGMEARIGRDGLLVAGELHDWRGWGNSLEKCVLLEGATPILEFTYAVVSGNATVRRSETVRVPVPAGREAEALEIVRQLRI